MRKSLLLAVLLLATGLVRAEVRLNFWQESRDEKTGEALFGFLLAPTTMMAAMEADAKGDGETALKLGEKVQAADAWMYGLLLRGEAPVYAAEKLLLFEPKPCGSLLALDSGTVEVDRKKRTVRVALKVTQDGKVIDFVGNGTFPIKAGPKVKAPKPKG